MMTNFATIRRSVKKMHNNIERMLAQGAELTSITKKERLTLDRERANWIKSLVVYLNWTDCRTPCSWLTSVMSTLHCKKLPDLVLKPFAMVDTNCDPNLVDFAIPANDDASKSIALVTRVLVDAIKKALEERKAMKSDLWKRRSCQLII